MPHQELENTKAQMRKGLLEYCILLIIARERPRPVPDSNKEEWYGVYASDILKELQAADLLVVEGTLYPLLSRLKADGLLAYEWRESEAGPPRKYYKLTPKGRENLGELTESWESLNDSISSLVKKSSKNL
jgi:PadR family transcriptional regulator, regulatory protein PadR